MNLVLTDRDHLQEGSRDNPNRSRAQEGDEGEGTCEEEMEPREDVTVWEEEPCSTEEGLLPQDFGGSRGVILLYFATYMLQRVLLHVYESIQNKEKIKTNLYFIIVHIIYNINNNFYFYQKKYVIYNEYIMSWNNFLYWLFSKTDFILSRRETLLPNPLRCFYGTNSIQREHHKLREK